MDSIVKFELLELELDMRLEPLWVDVLSRKPSRRAVWPLLRMAYGLGYHEALTEPVRGQLCLDHGLVVPARRKK